MQLGFVVKDLDAALHFWTKRMKVGPFVIMQDSLGDRRFIHRGQASAVRMSVALSYLGDTQIEVITQSNAAPSPYNEFFAHGRQGLHHIAFWPQDYSQSCRELERTGFEEVCSIELSDGTKNVSYFSGPVHLGLMVELVPMTATRRAYYGGIKALADGWDGTRPVRRFRSREDFMASEDCRHN